MLIAQFHATDRESARSQNCFHFSTPRKKTQQATEKNHNKSNYGHRKNALYVR